MPEDLLQRVDRAPAAQIVDREPMAEVVESEGRGPGALDDHPEPARHFMVAVAALGPEHIGATDPRGGADNGADRALVERHGAGAPGLGVDELRGTRSELCARQARDLFLPHAGILRKADHGSKVAWSARNDSGDVLASGKDNRRSTLNDKTPVPRASGVIFTPSSRTAPS